MIPPPPTSTLFPYTTLFRSFGPLALLLVPTAAELRQAVHEDPFVAVLPDERRRPFQFRDRLRELSLLLRSEEHTSELQSLTNLVCRLLLEKKKKHTPKTRLTHISNLPSAPRIRNHPSAR